MQICHFRPDLANFLRLGPDDVARHSLRSMPNGLYAIPGRISFRDKQDHDGDERGRDSVKVTYDSISLQSAVGVRSNIRPRIGR